MNAALRLASDFIERAANPVYGAETNEEYAFRWTLLRQSTDPVQNLNVGELTAADIDALSPEAWFWFGSNLGDGDPELPSDLVEALFTTTDDPIYRLRVADLSLRHPRLIQRYEGSLLDLPDLPKSWARDRLLKLTSESDPGSRGAAEMALIFLQVGNKPSLRLLDGLRRRRRPVVDRTLAQIAERTDDSFDALLGRLGLADG